MEWRVVDLPAPTTASSVNIKHVESEVGNKSSLSITGRAAAAPPSGAPRAETAGERLLSLLRAWLRVREAGGDRPGTVIMLLSDNP